MVENVLSIGPRIARLRVELGHYSTRFWKTKAKNNLFKDYADTRFFLGHLSLIPLESLSPSFVG